ncbi:MAG TPA: hypothetical protein VNS32_25070 [Flavisolibacter sp.]|jgi:threonine/homoserine/homoserine lactone efflux protein|nr:hypothetical protein [Flavisolibacter sp.]
MLEEYQDQQRKQIARMRSVMDYTMGVLLVIIGIYFLVYNKLKLNVFNRAPSSIDYLIGGLFILYGSWRIYRGYKKNYFR